MNIKKVLAIVLALTMCLTLVACGGGKKTESDGKKVVKLGVVEPLTGGSASVGANQVAAMKYAYKDYVDHYGLPGGYEIELVIGDSQGSADVGVTEAERLINEEHVNILIGTYNSGVGAAVAPIAIKYKVPFMVVNAVSDGILSEDSDYVYRANNCDTVGATLSKGYMQMLQDECKKQKGHDLKVAYIYDSGDWGTNNSASSKLVAEELGIDIVLDESIKTGTSDLSTLVTKLKNANPDYVFCYIYLDETILLIRQCKEVDYMFVGGGGGGFASAEFIDALGDDAEYFTASGGYIYDPSALNDEAKAIAEDFVKNTTGAIAPDEAFGNGWIGMYVICQALAKCKTNDSQKLAEAMDATNLSRDNKDEERTFLFNSVMQHIQFTDFPSQSGGMLYNQNADAVVMFTQVSGGFYKACYPNGQTINLCPPTWSAR